MLVALAAGIVLTIIIGAQRRVTWTHAWVNLGIATVFAGPLIWLAADDRLLNPAFVAHFDWLTENVSAVNTAIAAGVALVWAFDVFDMFRRAWRSAAAARRHAGTMTAPGRPSVAARTRATRSSSTGTSGWPAVGSSGAIAAAEADLDRRAARTAERVEDRAERQQARPARPGRRAAPAPVDRRRRRARSPRGRRDRTRPTTPRRLDAGNARTRHDREARVEPVQDVAAGSRGSPSPGPRTTRRGRRRRARRPRSARGRPATRRSHGTRRLPRSRTANWAGEPRRPSRRNGGSTVVTRGAPRRQLGGRQRAGPHRREVEHRDVAGLDRGRVGDVAGGDHVHGAGGRPVRRHRQPALLGAAAASCSASAPSRGEQLEQVPVLGEDVDVDPAAAGDRPRRRRRRVVADDERQQQVGRRRRPRRRGGGARSAGVAAAAAPARQRRGPARSCRAGCRRRGVIARQVRTVGAAPDRSANIRELSATSGARGTWMSKVRQEFVQRATEFLEANATRRVTKSDDFVWGEGPDNMRVMGSDDPEHENERLAAAAAWRAKAFDAGLAWAGGPAQYGGGGGDPELNDLWRELEADFEVPDQGAWGVAWDMVGPAVHGARQRRPQAALPRPDLPRRPAVLAAAQRAGGRLRPRRPQDPGRQGRRRVGRQRPEGLELLRPQGADRPADGAHRPGRAQAPGPDDVPAAARHARRRGPPAASR